MPALTAPPASPAVGAAAEAAPSAAAAAGSAASAGLAGSAADGSAVALSPSAPSASSACAASYSLRDASSAARRCCSLSSSDSKSSSAASGSGASASPSHSRRLRAWPPIRCTKQFQSGLAGTRWNVAPAADARAARSRAAAFTAGAATKRSIFARLRFGAASRGGTYSPRGAPSTYVEPDAVTTWSGKRPLSGTSDVVIGSPSR